MKKTKSTSGLIAKKPVSFWNKEVKIDIKKGFLSLSNLLISASIGDAKGAVKAYLSTLNALSIGSEPGHAAWLLIYKSYFRTIGDVFEEYEDVLVASKDVKINENEVAETMAHNMGQIDLVIEKSFFDNPSKMKFISVMEPAVDVWLKNFEISDDALFAIKRRIRQRFSFGLHDEWRNNAPKYAIVLEAIDSPFLKATAHQQSWSRYKNWLIDQTEKRMFNETFGLSDVFVPLRAYYHKRDKNETELDELSLPAPQTEKTTRHVVELEKEILNWAKNYKRDDCIKVLSGGPGSGKSSCSRMLVRKISEEIPDLPVLYIPLHQFDVDGELISAMRDYIEKDRFLSGNPLDPKEGEERLLIVFDGLDELSMRGQAAADSAKNFVDLIIDTSSYQSSQNLERQYLITGREIAVQAGAKRLRGEKQIMHLLPFLISDADEYKGHKKLIGKDQRNDWWKKYGKANGRNYNDFPSDLNGRDLEDITKEPLLNYLVALSFERNKIDFSNETTLNEIYDDMLEAVYSRQYESNKHSSIRELSQDKFQRILEEIALTVWHGNGRKATVQSIVENCKKSNLERYLEAFQENATGGVSRLLAAFYFRKSLEDAHNDESFEFTHKSFGEFLIAKRLTRLIRQVCEERLRNEEEPDSGWSSAEALEKWLRACGPTALDTYILRFFEREIRRTNDEELRAWKKIIAELMEVVINDGSAIESIKGMKFREIKFHTRNSEETLLVALNLISRCLSEVATLSLNTRTSFGEWLKSVQGQRVGPANRLVMSHLSYLGLGAQSFDMADLYGADMKRSDFNACTFHSASLHHANLSDSSFRGASFGRANLIDANFSRVVLKKAYLAYANLRGANFRGANLKGADLKGASLIGADLKESDIRDADLNDADLTSADLKGVNLKGAELMGANFTRADLDAANLRRIQGHRFK